VLGECRRPQNCICGVQWAPKMGQRPQHLEKCNFMACDTVDIGSCILRIFLAGKMKRLACPSAATTVLELTRLVAWCGVTSEETRPVIGRNKLCCSSSSIAPRWTPKMGQRPQNLVKCPSPFTLKMYVMKRRVKRGRSPTYGV
jgi:hypothetical protein